MVEVYSKLLDLGLYSSIMTHQSNPWRVSADGRVSLMPIDWSKAAWLTASGARAADIVRAVGCSRSQLHRRQQHCRLFGALVEQYGRVLAAVDGRQGTNGGRQGAGGQPLADTVREKLEQEIIDGNVKVTMWLAERLRLFSPEDKDGTDATLRRLLESMTEAERQAFSRAD